VYVLLLFQYLPFASYYIPDATDAVVAICVL